MTQLRIVSPKRDASSRRGWQGFFPYYAGFPDRFATELLSSADLPAGKVVWDPWNGSGTTTYAASSLGLDAAGSDINAVMVIVARARSLPVSEADSLVPIAMKIVAAASRSKAKTRLDDPLNQWFDSNTVAAIRSLDRSIRQHLVGKETLRSNPAGCIRGMSGLAASLYVCLFSVCREKLDGLRSSNPTWYRQNLQEGSIVQIAKHDLYQGFISLIESMRDELLRATQLNYLERGRVTLNLGDSTQGAFLDGGADFVLTSPPYCTRIDYAASTRIELAIIGPWLGIDAMSLSRAMIGTTRVPKLEPSPTRKWGKSCISFLKEVRDHPSKASRSYYYKNHLDYFDKMSQSLDILSKGVNQQGVAALVVQDSYYKDIHNPLPKILSEMCEIVGLQQFDQKDFSPSRSMSGINTGSSVYREHKKPVESVLLFKKEF